MIFSSSKKYNFGVCDLLLKNLYIYISMDHTFKNVLNTLLQTQVSYADLEFVTLLPFGIPFCGERKKKKQTSSKRETKEERTVS